MRKTSVTELVIVLTCIFSVVTFTVLAEHSALDNARIFWLLAALINAGMILAQLAKRFSPWPIFSILFVTYNVLWTARIFLPPLDFAVVAILSVILLAIELVIFVAAFNQFNRQLQQY